jgi:hypothetical protein
MLYINENRFFAKPYNVVRYDMTSLNSLTKAFLTIITIFLFQPAFSQIILKGKVYLNFHAEVKKARAAGFQILLKEDSVVVGKGITDAEGNFKIVLAADKHISHSEINEPSLDLYFIPKEEVSDTILAKSLTHFDSGEIEVNLRFLKRGFVPGDNGMPTCPKCRQSKPVERLDIGGDYGLFYCNSDRVRF